MFLTGTSKGQVGALLVTIKQNSSEVPRPRTKHCDPMKKPFILKQVLFA